MPWLWLSVSGRSVPGRYYSPHLSAGKGVVHQKVTADSSGHQDIQLMTNQGAVKSDLIWFNCVNSGHARTSLKNSEGFEQMKQLAEIYRNVFYVYVLDILNVKFKLGSFSQWQVNLIHWWIGRKTTQATIPASQLWGFDAFLCLLRATLGFWSKETTNMSSPWASGNCDVHFPSSPATINH